MIDPIWLDADEVIDINRDQLEGSTEEHVLISRPLLEGALGRPHNKWLYDGECEIPTLAAELCRAIVEAHAFGQGNKRTAFVAMNLFLHNNGYVFDIPDDPDCAQLITDLTGDGRETAMRMLDVVLMQNCQICPGNLAKLEA